MCDSSILVQELLIGFSKPLFQQQLRGLQRSLQKTDPRLWLHMEVVRSGYHQHPGTD